MLGHIWFGDFELLKRKCQVGIWIIRYETKEQTELEKDIWDSFSLEMVIEGISKNQIAQKKNVEPKTEIGKE